jgi:hypothetical protein
MAATPGIQAEHQRQTTLPIPLLHQKRKDKRVFLLSSSSIEASSGNGGGFSRLSNELIS